ncbi:MAG: hypothetical protein HKN04_13980 [Rhodothermaceae bacterium]|nr:hypothetical protein [Rhodothermaceae bacterium]
MAAPPPPSLSSLQDDAFFVDTWVAQPSLHTLHAPSGEPITLEPKVMQVLVCLASAPGKVVSRDELHACAWPDTFVTDKVLTRAISELRKAFGDDPHDPAIIATIPKKGYRLIAPVHYPPSGDAAPAAAPVTLSLPTDSRSPRSARRPWLWGGLFLLLALVVLGVMRLGTRADSAPTLSPPLALTTTPGHEVSPAVSPAGETIAFAWKGPEGDNWNIYVKQPGAEAALRLTDHPGDDTHPVWSPDGAHLAFVRYTDTDCRIMLVPALSGPERELASCFWYPASDYGIFSPKVDWSPDGRYLAFADRGTPAGSLHIALLDVETDSLRQVTTPTTTPLSHDTDPRFSTDGTRLAFLRSWGPGLDDLHTVNLETGEETRLTSDFRTVLGHDWAPDDRHLVFSSNRNGTFDLWSVPATGGAVQWIPATGWNLKAPSFAREGTRLAYENWTYDTNLWRIDLAGDAADTMAIASSLWDVHPQISPDGDRVAFVSNRGGSYELWTSAPDGTDAVALTAFGGPVVGAPRWSPDGEALAFEVRRTGPSDLYRIDADGGAVHQLTDTSTDEVVPSWSPDGAWLYFGSHAAGSWQIARVPARGGPIEQITETGGYAAALASDGTLYLARHGEAGLWQRTPAGEETLLLPDLAVGDWGNWTLTEAGIHFVDRSARPAVLTFYAFATGIATPVKPLSPGPPRNQPGLSLSPDGRWLLVMRLDQSTSDLMLLDDLAL